LLDGEQQRFQLVEAAIYPITSSLLQYWLLDLVIVLREKKRGVMNIFLHKFLSSSIVAHFTANSEDVTLMLIAVIH
jgi:hypothetical protein